VEITARQGSINHSTAMKVPMKRKINCDFSYAGQTKDLISHLIPRSLLIPILVNIRTEECFSTRSSKGSREFGVGYREHKCAGQPNGANIQGYCGRNTVILLIK
jgi:hypothetical protein